MTENVKYTIKQHIALILRGFRLTRNSTPHPVMLSLLLSSGLEAVVPFINLFFSALIINELAGQRDLEQLTALALWTIGLNLVAVLIQKLLALWAEYCGVDHWTEVRKIVSDKLLSMDYRDAVNPAILSEYHEIYRHHQGMGFGLMYMRQMLPGLIKGIAQIGLSSSLAFTLFTRHVPAGSPLGWLDSPLATAAVLVVLIIMVLVAPYMSIVGGKIWQKATYDNNKSNRFFGFYYYDMIMNSDAAKDIRIYNQKKIVQQQVETLIHHFNLFRQYSKYEAGFNTAGTAVTCLCNGIIYLFVALKALAGAFGVGDIVLYVGAITLFSSGFSSMLVNIGKLIINNPFLDKICKFLDIPNAMYMGSLTTEKRSDHKYELEFRNVSFKYPESDTYALRNVSLKFNVGQRLAIVGQNGSGKTTFIKLLCRLYDPDEGSILLNGIDIKKYDYREYMAIFSIVFQDFELLPFSLGENVATRMDYNDRRVLDTLESVGFGERLASLPNGFNTYLYKNFEQNGVEPSGALDPIAEFEVYSKMNDIVGDKTAVFISHRLSSCRFCDNIAVFHEGQVIQRGGHDELVANEDGKYYELWNSQSQYYIY
jgi:ATP-binding cassette subfamily B protein